jgi:hypothetical protein
VVHFGERRAKLILAILFASIMVLGNALLSPPSDGQVGLPGVLFGTGIAFAVAFLIAYGFLTLEEKLRTLWRARRLQEVAAPPSAVETFHWSGRPIQANRTGIAATLVVLAIFGSLFLIVSKTDQAVVALLFGVFILLVALSAFAFLAAIAPVAYEVNDTGIRYRRRLGRGFEATWNEVGRIETFSFDSLLFARPLGRPSRPLRMYLVIRKDGSRVGAFQARMELGENLGERCERALETLGAHHGVPIKEVRWSDFAPWRRGRRGPMEDRGSPPSTGEIR